MKRFDNCARQGEVYVMRVKALPKDAKPARAEEGQFILGHSETGHHHVVEAKPNIKFYSSNNPLVSYLEVIEATDQAEALLEHLRTFDTHDTICFKPGVYRIVNGRESSPEGWRRVSD